MYEYFCPPTVYIYIYIYVTYIQLIGNSNAKVLLISVGPNFIINVHKQSIIPELKLSLHYELLNNVHWKLFQANKCSAIRRTFSLSDGTLRTYEQFFSYEHFLYEHTNVFHASNERTNIFNTRMFVLNIVLTRTIYYNKHTISCLL